MSSNAINKDTVDKLLARDREVSDESDVRLATRPYQAEFPFERDCEAQVTRREFCNFLFLTSSSFFAGAAGFGAMALNDSGKTETFPPTRIEGAAQIEAGSAMNFSYPSKEDTAILIRAKDGSYTAFGQKCTHLSCPVHYAKATGRLECPCHEAGFSAKTGEVLYGPPPRPLDKIELEIHNGEVFAVKREVRGNES